MSFAEKWMGRTGDHDVKWNKSIPQRQVPQVFSPLWNLVENKTK
jgi:hypothetical protein